MGAANWLRRASGLLLPRTHFAQPYPCPDCCDGTEPSKPCDCYCVHCSTTSTPQFTAPCCWTVVISGAANASCTECATLNRAYYLYQDPLNPCRWFCDDVAGVLCLGSNDISLTVYRDSSSGDYKIRVELGSLDYHRWIKNYGSTSPLCCEIVGDELDNDTSRSDCDSSSATCTITRHTGDGKPCPCSTASCEQVIAPAPACLKIEWSGVSSSLLWTVGYAIAMTRRRSGYRGLARWVIRASGGGITPVFSIGCAQTRLSQLPLPRLAMSTALSFGSTDKTTITVNPYPCGRRITPVRLMCPRGSKRRFHVSALGARLAVTVPLEQRCY
ncbi:hypothetical protein LCGC14_0954340 [marine sediment metagenome]|uniref:Uncharacterized protein n=1 Tax=marine sediment metagenome TaxID=412755 RepID=A0A0F9NKU8_9ZZZZ